MDWRFQISWGREGAELKTISRGFVGLEFFNDFET